MKTIGLVTVARSDYYIYRPLLRAIQDDAELDLCLIVAGMHLSKDFGSTVNAIEADGFEIHARVDCDLSDDSPRGIARSIAAGTRGFADVFETADLDALIVLGDRFEMFAAVVAAHPFPLAIAHLHGGELTAGSVDEAFRHAITKMSHVHFVSAEIYKQRVIQMGEVPENVVVCGALGLDNLAASEPLCATELEQTFGLDLTEAPLLATMHPVTLEHGRAGWQIEQCLDALVRSGWPVVLTLPNADAGGRVMIDHIRTCVQNTDRFSLVDNMGTEGYFGLMKIARAMVGNSSSGILEAASFGLPVVNVGIRQEGRMRGGNVIDVTHDADAVLAGIERACSAEFRSALQDMVNPYWAGGAAPRIVADLKSRTLDARLLIKPFYDLPGGA